MLIHCTFKSALTRRPLSATLRSTFRTLTSLSHALAFSLTLIRSMGVVNRAMPGTCCPRCIRGRAVRLFESVPRWLLTRSSIASVLQLPPPRARTEEGVMFLRLCDKVNAFFVVSYNLTYKERILSLDKRYHYINLMQRIKTKKNIIWKK